MNNDLEQQIQMRFEEDVLFAKDRVNEELEFMQSMDMNWGTAPEEE